MSENAKFGPIGIFGISAEEIVEKILVIRKQLKSLNYLKKDQYLDTLPHLTLTVNQQYTGDLFQLKKLVNDGVEKIKAFSLHIKEFRIIDGDVAAVFENTYSAKLAQEIASSLVEQDFFVIETDHMKLIKTEIKREYQLRAKDIVEEKLSKDFLIEQIVIAGGQIRKKDILWARKLGQ